MRTRVALVWIMSKRGSPISQEVTPRNVQKGLVKSLGLLLLPTAPRAPCGPSPAAPGSGIPPRSLPGPGLRPGSFLATPLAPTDGEPASGRAAGPERGRCPQCHLATLPDSANQPALHRPTPTPRRKRLRSGERSSSACRPK